MDSQTYDGSFDEFAVPFGDADRRRVLQCALNRSQAGVSGQLPPQLGLIQRELRTAIGQPAGGQKQE